MSDKNKVEVEVAEKEKLNDGKKVIPIVLPGKLLVGKGISNLRVNHSESCI